MTGVEKLPEVMETPTEQQLELRSEGHAEGFFTAALQLREQDLLVDTAVTLGQKDYKAHSILLAAVSSVFLQRLESGVQEGMNLDSVTTPSGWEAILNFAYTGELEPTPIMAEDILDAAEALGVPRVAEICKAVLIGTENEGRLSPVEEKWKTLQRLEELYNEGIGWDTELKAEGDTFRGIGYVLV
uniref:BTB domain-containing protein n=1 Tax=Pseudonaja textilis TaxID=8673 RepID=A0A670ZIA9_PSETE